MAYKKPDRIGHKVQTGEGIPAKIPLQIVLRRFILKLILHTTMLLPCT